MKVAYDCANGLSYLHDAGVILQDIKTSNMLLDLQKYNAEFRDFGLAKNVPQDQDYLSIRLMGTQGYAAPKYLATGHLTKECDVYSFGVVLIELMIRKRVLDNLIHWSRRSLHCKRKVLNNVDPKIDGQWKSREVMRVAQLAQRCRSADSKFRPQMEELVTLLLQLVDSDTCGERTSTS